MQRLLLRSVIVAAILILGVFVLVETYTQDCKRRETHPDAPIYPNSTLVNKSAMGSTYSSAADYYSSPDAPENVVAYYKQNSQCPDSTNGIFLCTGSAVPFGDYSVRIDGTLYNSTKVTEFIVEFKWHGCGYKLK